MTEEEIRRDERDRTREQMIREDERRKAIMDFHDSLLKSLKIMRIDHQGQSEFEAIEEMLRNQMKDRLMRRIGELLDDALTFKRPEGLWGPKP